VTIPAYRMPAEWQPHDAVWLAWPSHAEEWPGELDGARREHAALCAAIADVDPATGVRRGERVHLLVLPGESEASARTALAGVPVELEHIPFGDVWLRDTGPLWLDGPDGPVAACFRWNGWGGKYHFPDDDRVGVRIAELTATPALPSDLILEGGAIEVDGEGTVLTTRPCVLDDRRNPGLTQAAAEEVFARVLGATRTLWLDHALANDHTDGHIDTLVRFTRPGHVVCMAPSGDDDPNRDVLLAIRQALAGMTDAAGRRLEITTVPSPGRVASRAGELLAASYANYYVGNTTVVVPTYGVRSDREAVDTIGRLYPGRRVVGASARSIITGGGAFHCITQQQPTAAARRAP
jgi:agmatine deiminase